MPGAGEDRGVELDELEVREQCPGAGCGNESGADGFGCAGGSRVNRAVSAGGQDGGISGELLSGWCSDTGGMAVAHHDGFQVVAGFVVDARLRQHCSGEEFVEPQPRAVPACVQDAWSAVRGFECIIDGPVGVAVDGKALFNERPYCTRAACNQRLRGTRIHDARTGAEGVADVVLVGVADVDSRSYPALCQLGRAGAICNRWPGIQQGDLGPFRCPRKSSR